MSNLHVTAMTLSCAAGVGLDAVRASLNGNRSGLRANDFSDCSLETWIGRVEGVEAVELDGAWAEFDCRNNQLARLALSCDDFSTAVAGLRERVRPERIACIIGTSTAGIGSTEAAYRNLDSNQQFAPRYRLPRVHTPHTSSAFTARVLGLEGPVSTVSTACSSSAKVFASAARMIESGWADAAVVGGVDSLCLSVLYGFHSLELVSDSPCQPFDLARRGINLGEAAGFAILEKAPAEASLGRVLGWGETSDAHHMASPHPEGTGATAAMRQALNHAGLSPADVGYINCHGTATPLNDQVEAGAIRRVFPEPPPSSSTKGWTGHTLGAAGITEIVFSLLALNDELLPGTLNCSQPDPAWSDFILTEARRERIDVALTNSFGFGGSNCSVALGRP